MDHKLNIKYILKIILVAFLLLSGLQGAYAQSWQWAARVGGVGGNSSDHPNESVQDMQTDAQGNVYVCGRMGHNANFNGQPLTTWPNVGYNIFLAKLDCNGNLVWVRTAGGTHPNNEARGLALDGQGHIYLTGQAAATLGFNTCTFFDTLLVENSLDLFLAKFDTSGNFLWVTVAAPGPATLYSIGCHVKVDNFGMVHVSGRSPAGDLYNGFNFSGWSLIARFDTAGNINRIINVSPSQGVQFYDFKISPDGDHYVTGYFSSDSALIGTQMLYKISPSTARDLFFAKFDSSGIFQWVVHLGDTLFTTVQGTGIDFFPNGDVALAGDITPGVSIGPFTFSNSLSSNLSRPMPFVARFSPQGQVIWADNAENQFVTSTTGGVKVLSDNRVAFSGFFGGNASFGNASFISNGLQDIFVGIVSSSGIIDSAARIDGTGGKEEPLCITSDTNDNVYIGGGFNGTLTVNGTTYTSAGGNSDGFVAKFGTICAVGLSETQGDAGQPLIVYPNPVTSRLYVTLPDRNQLSELTIVDLSGATVVRKSINNHPSGDVSIDVSSLPSGFYILRAQSKSGVKAAKFVKWLNQ